MVDGVCVEITAQFIVVSDIVDGYRVHKKYSGYSVPEAVELFKAEYLADG